MIDTFLSKLFLSVAVIVIVGALVGLFSLQKEAFRAQELEATCDSVQMRVDEISSLNAETTVLFTYGEGQSGEAVKLPHEILGKPYTMDFYTTAVRIKQDNLLGRATFSHTVHLFYPGDLADITASDLESIDGVFPSLRVEAEQNLLVERRYFESSGYQTFVYMPSSVSNQSVARDLAESIDEHAQSAKGTYDIECPDCDVALIPNFVVARGVGYSCVAKVHVNQTYDPETVWSSTQAVGMDEFTAKGSEHNEVITVKKGDSFVLERYWVSVKVKYYTVGSTVPTELTIKVVQSFAYGA